MSAPARTPQERYASPEDAPRCPRCGYSLFALECWRCPECGLDIEGPLVTAARWLADANAPNRRVARRESRLFWSGLASYPLGLLIAFLSAPALAALLAMTGTSGLLTVTLLWWRRGELAWPAVAVLGYVFLAIATLLPAAL